MPGNTDHTSPPLSFSAEQMLAGTSRWPGAGPGDSLSLCTWVLGILKHHKSLAQEVDLPVDMGALEAEAHRRMAEGQPGEVLSREEVVGLAVAQAREAGRPVVAPADVAATVLGLAAQLLVGEPPVPETPDLSEEAQDRGPEPTGAGAAARAVAESEAPGSELPSLSFASEQMLGTLEQRLQSITGGTLGAFEWLSGVLLHHMELVVQATEGADLGDLVAGIRRNLEAGDKGGGVGREAITVKAGEHAREAGRSVVTPDDLATAIVAIAAKRLVEPESVEPQPPEPELAEEVAEGEKAEPEPIQPREAVEPTREVVAAPEAEEEPGVIPAAGRPQTFRLFVSSTFQDLRAERNALHAYVFPRLRELCRRHDCRFQAIDLRWGVSEQAALDQQTMNICLREIERCHMVTPRPNFLVLLGDRYGWRPPPPHIEVSEFMTLVDHVLAEERELLLWDPKQPAEKAGWYRRDDNADPPEYRLRPRSVDLSNCTTRDEREAARRAEASAWAEIEVRLHQALEDAAQKASLPDAAPPVYETSATEQEIALGALQVADPQEKVLCFFRSLRGLPEDLRPREFLETVEERTQDLGRALSSVATACLHALEDLPKDASAGDVRDVIAKARQTAGEDDQERGDLEILMSWLRDAIAHDFRDLDVGWQPDGEAEARLQGLKTRLKGTVPDNVVEYEARWTGRGASTDHLGSLPEDLDECLALLDAPKLDETLCAKVWRRLAGTILGEIEDPMGVAARPGIEIHVRPDDGLDPEGRAHCDFANDLLRFFVGRGTPLGAIRDYLAGQDRSTLAVVAEGGAGKSALMAKALEGALSAYPNAEIVYRFIGTTPSSSDGRSLLVSLCREISRRFGEEEGTPFDYTELVPELEKRMATATSQRPLILFLDALDQLSEAHGARNLTWLPRQLPEGVRVVVSTRREAETFAAVMRFEPEEVELGPMSRQDGEELLNLWLDYADRTLTPEQGAVVLDAFEDERSGGRPLYLKLAFEEARLWPSYVPADDLEPLEPGIEGVIRENLFDRLAREENHGEQLVARTLGYLAASRYGLAEDELVDVLSRDQELYISFLEGSYHLPSDLVARALEYGESHGLLEEGSQTDEGSRAETWLGALVADPARTAELQSFLDEVLPRHDGPRLPVVLWSRLFFDLAPYLTERLGDGTSLLDFYHRELGEVATDAFAGDAHGRTLHGRLADYFRDRADPDAESTWDGGDVRGLSELPYHLTEAGQWNRVHDTLTDFRFLEHKAAEVGVVESAEGQGETVTTFTGVYLLQDDFEHALQKIPGGLETGAGQRPLIVTATDFGDGHVVRCPWCNTGHPLPDSEEERQGWLGQEISCPAEGCGKPLKLNPFLVPAKT